MSYMLIQHSRDPLTSHILKSFASLLCLACTARAHACVQRPNQLFMSLYLSYYRMLSQTAAMATVVCVLIWQYIYIYISMEYGVTLSSWYCQARCLSCRSQFFYLSFPLHPLTEIKHQFHCRSSLFASFPLPLFTVNYCCNICAYSSNFIKPQPCGFFEYMLTFMMWCFCLHNQQQSGRDAQKFPVETE